ncbi:MAG TPA: hypothetical protein VD932_05345 [Aquabacterium sp.]|nr:hypothetical protein [Aquabacterium sp.]
MDWYRITCWRCRCDFLDTDPSGGYCAGCGAPRIGMRGDGQYVRHASVLVGPLPEPATPPARPGFPVPHQSPARDDDGLLRIYQWRLRSATTGKLYTTRHKLAEPTAKAIDPDAVPVGEPEVIHGTGGTRSTGDLIRPTREADAPPGTHAQDRTAGPLPGWRDGSQHQWSRDPGRVRRYR